MITKKTFIIEIKKENKENTQKEVDVYKNVSAITNFIKYIVESFSNAEVYTDNDDDPEKHRVIEFRENVCGQQQKILLR